MTSPPTRNSIAVLLAAPVLVGTALCAGDALGSPTFPQEIQRALDMPCVPQCTICHRDSAGGFATVDKPFGWRMDRAGLTPRVPASVAPVLAELEARGADADSSGNGVNDVVELRAGNDPNEAGASVCGVRYGCGARVAWGPDITAPGGAGAVMAALLVMTASRRLRQEA